jgi:hypothetical protein
MWMVQIKGLRAKDERPLKFVLVNAEVGIPLTYQPIEHFEKTVRLYVETAGSKSLSDSNLRNFSAFWKGSNKWKSRAISRYRCDVDEIATLLGCCAVCSGKSQKFWDNLWVPSSGVKKSMLYFLTPEDGTDGLSRNVGKDIPLHAA